MRDNIQAYQWESGRSRNEKDSETIWVIIKSVPTAIAIGLVYVGIGKFDMREWNNIYYNLQQDISELKWQGRKVLLMGDFSGHVTKGEERVGEWETDRNGERLINLINQE